MPGFDLKKLEEYALKILDRQSEILSVETEELIAGESPAEVTNIRLTLDACPDAIHLIQKNTYPTEVMVMLALAELENASSIPIYQK